MPSFTKPSSPVPQESKPEAKGLKKALDRFLGSWSTVVKRSPTFQPSGSRPGEVTDNSYSKTKKEKQPKA